MIMAKPAQKILFFYCYTCRDYEPKTSPHYRAQNNDSRDAARKKKPHSNNPQISHKNEKPACPLENTRLGVSVNSRILAKCFSLSKK
jgi:hypothetical protein